MAGISGFECLEGVLTIPKKSHLCAWCHNYDISHDNMVCTTKNVGYNVKSILSKRVYDNLLLFRDSIKVEF